MLASNIPLYETESYWICLAPYLLENSLIIFLVEGLITVFVKTTISPSAEKPGLCLDKSFKVFFMSWSTTSQLESTPFYWGVFNLLESYNESTEEITLELGVKGDNVLGLMKIGLPSLVFTSTLAKSLPS